MPRGNSKPKVVKSSSTGDGQPTGRGPSMAPSGAFVGKQEGQRFLAKLRTIAVSPRNLREEWEYTTEEFQEFKENIKGTDELIQDPVVSSKARFIQEYPEHAEDFPAEIEWILIAGERRFKAAVSLHGPDGQIPIVLRNKLLGQGDFALLSENTYRKGWDPIQEAHLIQRIQQEKNLTYDQILERLGGQSAIKRKADISKRVKLLELKDGPLRRAIRLGEIGLEPAYTLVSKLKEQELIEQGWALMQRESIRAVEACKQLLGEEDGRDSQTETQSGAAETESENTASEAGKAGASGSFVNETRTSETETTTSSEERTASTSGAGAHTQPTGESASNSSLPAPRADGEGRGESEASSALQLDEDSSRRVEACQRVLGSLGDDPSTRVVPAALTAAIVVLQAPPAVAALAADIAGWSTLAEAHRASRVLRLLADGDATTLNWLADAVVLASSELNTRHVGEDGDALAVSYLTLLRDQVGAGGGATQEPDAVSSTKL